MEKLQKINFKQCDVIPQEQLNTVKGGMSQETVTCVTGNGNDTAYVTNYDDGRQSTGLLVDD